MGRERWVFIQLSTMSAGSSSFPPITSHSFTVPCFQQLLVKSVAKVTTVPSSCCNYHPQFSRSPLGMHRTMSHQVQAHSKKIRSRAFTRVLRMFGLLSWRSNGSIEN